MYGEIGSTLQLGLGPSGYSMFPRALAVTAACLWVCSPALFVFVYQRGGDEIPDFCSRTTGLGSPLCISGGPFTVFLRLLNLPVVGGHLVRAFLRLFASRGQPRGFYVDDHFCSNDGTWFAQGASRVCLYPLLCSIYGSTIVSSMECFL